MYATYHLKSAEEINSDIIDSIKATFKSKAITIRVEESDDSTEITSEMKAILDERIEESSENDFSAEDSIGILSKKYGI